MKFQCIVLDKTYSSSSGRRKIPGETAMVPVLSRENQTLRIKGNVLAVTSRRNNDEQLVLARVKVQKSSGC